MSTHVQPPPLAGLTHHRARLSGTTLHYVTAGSAGPPVLLVHGFPETWWAFHRVIPLLAARHRVVAVDLRGFGDSAHDEGATYDSATAAQDLHELIDHLALGPVHLVGQDIAGATVVRLAATRPADVRSLTAIEMGLAGYGLEALADVTRGGTWHIGVMATPGIPELLLAGRERELLADWVFPTMTAVRGAVGDADVDELARTYAGPGGWRGAAGLYRSMLTEGDELRALLGRSPLTMPVLAVGGGGGAFTVDTMRQVTAGSVAAVQLDGVGHHVAFEAPAALAEALGAFIAEVGAA